MACRAQEVFSEASVGFSAESLQAGRQWADRFKALKEKLSNKNTVSRKLLFKDERN